MSRDAGDFLSALTAEALLEGYRSKAFTPLEVTDALLDRIGRCQDSINAFTFLDPETSRSQARDSAARWQAGRPRGRLEGVPVAIKDLLLTKGWPTRRGSKTIDADQPWTEDAPAVARLREHGAVLIGKTTTPEFGWKGVTDNPLDGITRNPWDPSRTPGGSSGGASAALAACLCPLAIGTDGGGSIRIPASFAGVFGLKPSFGRVPAWPLSPFGTVAHLGPMARTVRDAALFLTVIAGADGRDWYSMAADGRNYLDGIDAGVKGARIAYSPRLGYADVEPETASLVERAVHVLKDLGAEIEEIDPGFDNPKWIFRKLWWAGAGFALGGYDEAKLALLEPDLRAVVEEGKQIPLKDYLLAVKAREDLGTRMRLFMEKFDFLVTPAVAIPAFEAGRVAPQAPDGDNGDYWVNWTPFSYPFNLTQQPAASVPGGFTKAGLPVGIQIAGRMFDDAGVMRASRALEQALNIPTLATLP